MSTALLDRRVHLPPSAEPPRQRLRVAALLAGVAVVLVVLRLGGVGVGGSDADIALLPDDLPLPYSAAEFTPAVMDDCLVANRVERVEDAVLGGAAYESSQAGSRIRLLTIRTASAGQLFGELRSLLSSCEPSVNQVMSGDVFLQDTTTRQVVDGPPLGDESFWIATETDIVHSLSATLPPTDTGPSHSVVYRRGDQIAWLSVGLESDMAVVHDLGERTLR